MVASVCHPGGSKCSLPVQWQEQPLSLLSGQVATPGQHSCAVGRAHLTGPCPGAALCVNRLRAQATREGQPGEWLRSVRLTSRHSLLHPPWERACPTHRQSQTRCGKGDLSWLNSNHPWSRHRDGPKVQREPTAPAESEKEHVLFKDLEQTSAAEGVCQRRSHGGEKSCTTLQCRLRHKRRGQRLLDTKIWLQINKCTEW